MSLTSAGNPRRAASRRTRDFESRKSAQTRSNATANDRVTLSFNRTSCGSHVARRSSRSTDICERPLVRTIPDKRGQKTTRGTAQPPTNCERGQSPGQSPSGNQQKKTLNANQVSQDRHRPMQPHLRRRPTQRERAAPAQPQPPPRNAPTRHRKPRPGPSPSNGPDRAQDPVPDQRAPCSSRATSRPATKSQPPSDQNPTQPRHPNRHRNPNGAARTTVKSTGTHAAKPCGPAHSSRDRNAARVQRTARQSSTRRTPPSGPWHHSTSVNPLPSRRHQRKFPRDPTPPTDCDSPVVEEYPKCAIAKIPTKTE